MSIKTLYIFVRIKIDVNHLVKTIEKNIPKNNKICLLSTVQFTKSINEALNILKEEYSNIIIPQEKPLSSGEVLGCTSPNLSDYDTLIFVSDGRFHIEVYIYVYNYNNNSLQLFKIHMLNLIDIIHTSIYIYIFIIIIK